MIKKLSIITVTYNNLSELQSTLDSISDNLIDLNIDDFELVIIDGGTVSFSYNLTNNLDCVVVSEKDNGVFDAMNKGLDFARGDYVLFLNSGDIFYNRFVLTNFLNVYTKYNNINILAGKVHQVYKTQHSIRTLEPYFNHQSVFVKRKLALQYRFDDNLKFYGDLDFWKRIENDKNLIYERFDFIVSSFFMGGIGNSPKFLFERLIERNKLCDSFVKKLLRYIFTIVLFLVYKIFGVNLYYRFIL